MTPHDLKAAAEILSEIISPIVKPKAGPPGFLAARLPDVEREFAHLKWMCAEIASWAEDAPEAWSDALAMKAHRWLGFVQGVAWSWGMVSIDELRRISSGSRPWEDPR